MSPRAQNSRRNLSGEEREGEIGGGGGGGGRERGERERERERERENFQSHHLPSLPLLRHSPFLVVMDKEKQVSERRILEEEMRQTQMD